MSAEEEKDKTPTQQTEGENISDKKEENKGKKSEKEAVEKKDRGETKDLPYDVIKEIKSLSESFWDAYGSSHDVSEWKSHADGAKLMTYFDRYLTGKSIEDMHSDLRNSSKFVKCWEKYQKETGEKKFDFDEDKVDGRRVKNEIDIAFFLSIRDLPKLLLSEANFHTRNWVISKIDNGVSKKEIFEQAAKMAGDKLERLKTEGWEKKEESLNVKNTIRGWFGMEQKDLEEEKKKFEEKVEFKYKSKKDKFLFILGKYRKEAVSNPDKIIDDYRESYGVSVENEEPKKTTSSSESSLEENGSELGG